MQSGVAPVSGAWSTAATPASSCPTIASKPFCTAMKSGVPPLSLSSAWSTAAPPASSWPTIASKPDLHGHEICVRIDNLLTSPSLYLLGMLAEEGDY
jgi:hypothetical protein